MSTTSVSLPKRRAPLVLAAQYLAGFLVGAIAVPLVLAALSVAFGSPPSAPLSLKSALIAVLLSPLIEEFLFRWLPFKVLASRTRVAILVGALAFGLTHWFAHPAVGIIAFMAGILFGIVYAKSRNIWHPVLMHSGVNSGALAITLLLGTGIAGTA